MISAGLQGAQKLRPPTLPGGVACKGGGGGWWNWLPQRWSPSALDGPQEVLKKEPFHRQLPCHLSF